MTIKYLIIAVVLGLAILAVLRVMQNRLNTPARGNGFFIDTDKRSYKLGEAIKIFFTNNTTTTKQAFLGDRVFNIEKKVDVTDRYEIENKIITDPLSFNWIEVSQEPCWEGPTDIVWEPPAPLVFKLKPGRTGKFVWDQMERRCEIIEGMRKQITVPVGDGIYRIWTQIGNEDGKNLETVVSGEFSISE